MNTIIILKTYINGTELICITVMFGLNPEKSKDNMSRRWTKNRYERKVQYNHENVLNSLQITEPDDHRNFIILSKRTIISYNAQSIFNPV